MVALLACKCLWQGLGLPLTHGKSLAAAPLLPGEPLSPAPPLAPAALQSNVQGLKVAAATLLLSADAGMGPATAMLAFAKDALDAVMQMQ